MALLVLLGGLLVTGSANIINQISEKDLDKLMRRNEARPLPTGRVSVNKAWAFCVVLGVAVWVAILLPQPDYGGAVVVIARSVRLRLYAPQNCIPDICGSKGHSGWATAAYCLRGKWVSRLGCCVVFNLYIISHILSYCLGH